MSETYAFLFCLALGIVARGLYICVTALARRTDILPVTVILDALTVMAVGGGFTAYVVLTGTVIAPYMFAALLSGYLIAYWLTHSASKQERKNHGSEKRSKRRAAQK